MAAARSSSWRTPPQASSDLLVVKIIERCLRWCSLTTWKSRLAASSPQWDNLKPEQTNIFFKLMEERYRRFATIITTNLDYDEWSSFLGNQRLVAALLSRLRHQCHTVKIDGPSLRDPQG